MASVSSATHSVEYFDESLVDEERFKEKRNNCCGLSQNEEYCVEPCELALEDGEESDLREICKYKEGGEDDDRK